MGFIFSTGPVNLKTPPLFSHQCHDSDFNQEQRHVIISWSHNEALNRTTKDGARSKRINHISVVKHAILINLLETNRNSHWPCFLVALSL